MTAKEYLKQISRMESFIDVKRQRLNALKDLASNIGASAMDGMPKSPSKSSSPMADAVCKAIDLENEIKADEAKLQKRKVFMLDLIGTLENVDEQAVLIKRYFEHQSWENIAAELYYTTRWVYKLHGHALESLNHRFEGNAEVP